MTSTETISHRRARDARQILALTLLHRLVCCTCVVLIASLPPIMFDTSPVLSIGLSGRTTLQSKAAQLLSLSLLRWDSLHFLGMASKVALPFDAREQMGTSTRTGLHAEQSLAFQPGIVWMLRASGSLSSQPLNLPGAAWSPIGSVLLTSCLAMVVSIALPLCLYSLTLQVTQGNRAVAKLAAMLSVLFTSPSTLITPTPEPFFALLALLAHLAVLRARQERLKRGVAEAAAGPRFMLASLMFGLATAFRANGILFAGFIIWQYWWESHSRTRSRRHLLTKVFWTMACCVVISAPFVFSQIWAYDRFCQRHYAFDRPWCTLRIPIAYSFVQSAYWDVGAFRYWTFAQLPNWLLAAPILSLAFYWPLSVYRSDAALSLRITLSPFFEASEHQIVERDIGQQQALTDDKKSLLTPFQVYKESLLLPHAHYTVFALLTLLLSAHIQIILRFATQGALPAVWWAMSDNLLRRGRPSAGKGRTRLCESMRGKQMVTLLVMWNIVSVALFAGFYPPA